MLVYEKDACYNNTIQISFLVPLLILVFLCAAFLMSSLLLGILCRTHRCTSKYNTCNAMNSFLFEDRLLVFVAGGQHLQRILHAEIIASYLDLIHVIE